MKCLIKGAALALLTTCVMQATHAETAAPVSLAVPSAVSDADISDAYLYLLGRILVLRQQRVDFEQDGFQWNQLFHRKLGEINIPNPNLDVVYSEAWLAADENTCVRVDIPEIKGRYYTWHMLNGWGEILLNINERSLSEQPFGHYAFCLKGGKATPPAELRRIDLPTPTAHVLARVELADDPQEAIRLQHEFKLTALGEPKIAPMIKVPLFDNSQMPRVDAFDYADAILAGEPDLNPGMEAVRGKVAAVSELLKNGETGRQRVSAVIAQKALPEFAAMVRNVSPPRNGWVYLPVQGSYGDNYRMRTLLDYGGIWANSRSEYATYANKGLDGAASYTLTFAKDALPRDQVNYYWSITAVDAKRYRVLSNALDRHVLNDHAPLSYNADGSLTLAFGPKLAAGVAQSNWLPTVEGVAYNLSMRLYGARGEAAQGRFELPEMTKAN